MQLGGDWFGCCRVGERRQTGEGKEVDRRAPDPVGRERQRSEFETQQRSGVMRARLTQGADQRYGVAAAQEIPEGYGG